MAARSQAVSHMVRKWGWVLCAAWLLAFAWAPVFLLVNGSGQSARGETGFGVGRLPARLAIAPWFPQGGAGSLDPRPALARLIDPLAPDGARPADDDEAAQPGAGTAQPLPIALPDRPYARLVQQAAERHGVDPRLVHALIEVESNYRADAVSYAGAMGLMQLMPLTAERYGVSNPLDPASNIDAGTRHLRDLLDEFGPFYEDVLAAYNLGETRVRRHGGIPPWPQAHRFVRRVMRILRSQPGPDAGD